MLYSVLKGIIEKSKHAQHLLSEFHFYAIALVQNEASRIYSREKGECRKPLKEYDNIKRKNTMKKKNIASLLITLLMVLTYSLNGQARGGEVKLFEEDAAVKRYWNGSQLVTEIIHFIRCDVPGEDCWTGEVEAYRTN